MITRDDVAELRAISNELYRNSDRAHVIVAHVPGDVFDGWVDRIRRIADHVENHLATEDRQSHLRECDEEIRTWDVFRPEQIDSYWMKCDRRGDHVEHWNSETGGTWRTDEDES